ncbi:MAG: GNAT family N-acetyltransferase [Bdellovibrionales bacterium]|nr:GNAT family N-acetyltransferase [Bdellovibrionales bacterium]
MSFQVITDWAQLRQGTPSIAEQWDHLLLRAPTQSVFSTLAWLETWWRHFGEQAQLRLLLLRDDAGRLLAAAPFMIEERKVLGRRERVLSFVATANYAADYADFLVEDGDPQKALPRFAAWIAEHVADWTLLDFINWPAHSPHAPIFASELARLLPGVRSDRIILYDAPSRCLGRDSKEDLACANKKSLKRHTNALKREGTVEFTHLTDPAQVATELETFFEQHKGRRELAGFKSQFDDPRERRFYHDLARALLPLGLLRFSTLRLNGIPLAYHFGFEREGIYTWYKPAFEAKFEDRSPGEVLIKHLLEHCIAGGLKEFDFTVGNEAFKYRFSNEIRRILRYRVYQRETSWWLMSLRRALGKLYRRILGRRPGGGVTEA